MIMMHGDHQHQSDSILNACSVILLIMLPKSQLLQIDATEIDCADQYTLRDNEDSIIAIHQFYICFTHPHSKLHFMKKWAGCPCKGHFVMGQIYILIVIFQAGKTALDKARDNNHKDVALLLARAPQVGIFLHSISRILNCQT